MARYDESSIKSLNWREHIRLRPGMYIGKLGNGKNPDDGIYVLIKEIVDNCIDEYVMGFGDKVEININENTVSIDSNSEYLIAILLHPNLFKL